MGYIWSIYGYFEALISQILAFLWSEFLLYQFSAPNLDKGTIFFPTPPRPRMIEQYIPLLDLKWPVLWIREWKTRNL